MIWISFFRLAEKSGGGKRDRTDDLLNANQALSQLSYTPRLVLHLARITHKKFFAPEMVRFASQKLLGRGCPQPRPEGRYPRSNLTIGLLLRKEVIQPLVPQRLPCYDFIPVIDHTLGAFFLVKG